MKREFFQTNKLPFSGSPKGISPLIAAVLLIAFTMAIAGIMATWATTFSRERLIGAAEEADCVGALDLSNLVFNNGTVGVRIKNLNHPRNLTGMTAIIEYPDITKPPKNYVLKDYNVTDPLSLGAATIFVVNTGDTTKPQRLEVVASNCPRESVALNFR